MKIIVFAKENLSLTGGNIYDSLIFNSLKQDLNFNIEFYEPRIHKSGFAINKLITPFIELKWLKKIKHSDAVFWNSVDAYHCLLLIFFVNFFLPNKKTFVLHHHYKFMEMNGIKKIFFKFFEINFLKMASSIIIPSPYILYETKKYLPSNNLTYLEIGFDENKIDKKKQINKGHMLFVGNIEHRKGLHLLVESLNILKEDNNNFFVNVIGSIIEKDYFDNLTEIIKKYGLENNIIFHGRVSNEEKNIYFQNSDFFIFPSLLEGYGMVIIEAMSYGLPVVAFNNSAMPYTIKNGYNGLLATNEDIHDLMRKMSNVLSDENLREILSNGALETFSKCRKLNILKDEIKLFVKTIRNHKNINTKKASL